MKRSKLNALYMPSALALAIATFGPEIAMAQTGSGANAADDASVSEQQGSADASIVVTGSRIQRDGYRAPTPVMVAPTEALTQATPTSLSDGLNKLPQFVGSVSSDNGAHSVPGNGKNGNFLNLRNLGSNRMLVLLDGKRVAPTGYAGTVDVGILPNLLVQRVDVVTTGASAAYGSDAISGAVNYVLDRNFKGVKGVVQSGISQYGDYQNYRVGLAAGIALGERTRLLLSAERYENDGYEKGERPEYGGFWAGVGKNPGAGPAGTAANPFVLARDVHWSAFSFAGHAISGPFAGTIFPTAGTYRPVKTGTPTPGTSALFTGDSDYVQFRGNNTQSARIKTTTGFANLSHDLTDDIEVWVQGSAAEFVQNYYGNFNSTASLTLFEGNAFLPDALNDLLAPGESFRFTKNWSEYGPSPVREKLVNYIGMAGLRGDMGGFKWDVSYQYSRSEHKMHQENVFDSARLAAAVDAVWDGDRIVCRPSLSADPVVAARYADCKPINPFGLGAADPEAWAYVMGPSNYRAVNSTNDVTATVSGDIFDLPAGAVSIAIGGTYRDQKLDLTSDTNPAELIDISGLRGIAATATKNYYTNVGFAKGKLTVKEAFGEIAVPVLKDAPFARSLDLNGAVRMTDYSTSGTVTTWKVGGTWAPVDGLLFRVTRSRDIRAPTLYELFAGVSSIPTSLTDPHTNYANQVFAKPGGNTNLKPEVGDNLSIGVVAQPRFLPGLSFSLDYYKLKIRDAIASPTALEILQECENSGGTAPACSLITRPLPYSDRTPDNFPTAIAQVPLNLAVLKAEGLDFDASYEMALGSGKLTSRLYATYVTKFETQSSANQAPQRSIEPKLRSTISFNYEIGDLGFFLQGQYIGKAYRSFLVVWEDNTISPIFYTDATITAKVRQSMGDLQLFATVNNLFNTRPPIDARSGSCTNCSYPTNARYDITGRRFTVGARFKF